MALNGQSLLSEVRAPPNRAFERKIAAFFRELLLAVKDMHEKHQAHMDLRPENLMLNDTGHVCLLQSPLTVTLAPMSPIAGMDMYADAYRVIFKVEDIGSPEFVAPEVAAWMMGSMKADIWAIGVLAYVLLTGISPFYGDSDEATIALVKTRQFSLEPRDLPAAISDDAKNFLETTLIVDESSRPTAAQSLEHNWIKNANGQRLNPDFLDEFQYRHQWVERRVFVPKGVEPAQAATATQHTLDAPTSRVKHRPTPLVLLASTSTMSDSEPSTPAQSTPAQSTEVDAGQLPTGNGSTANRYSIEEEIAERVLSDISEEDAAEILTNPPPTPGLDKEATPTQAMMDQVAPQIVSQLKSVTVVGRDPAAPVHVRTQSVESDQSVPQLYQPFQSPKSPRGLFSPKSPRPAMKSPIRTKLSPPHEAVMEVVIAMKHGKEGRFSDGSSVGELSPQGRVEPTPTRTPYQGYDYEKARKELQAKKDSILKDRGKISMDMDYAPPDVDFDEYDWESNYQMGPETFLMSAHDPKITERIRNYRRELWGDSAPLAQFGILGWRNQDVTVRERRRFSDLLRESPALQRCISIMDADRQMGMDATTLRRVNSDAGVVMQKTPVYKKDGEFAPVFIQRLRESTYEPRNAVTLSVVVTGNPKPTVRWYHNESLVVESARVHFSHDGNKASMNLERALGTDYGTYTVMASNSMGEAACSAQLKIGDLPERPSRPDVALASDTEVFMTWEEPDTQLTGLEITGYRLEYRRAGDDDWACPWMLASDRIDEEAVVLRHLEPLGIYQFRVTAKNVAGWGEPSLASRIIRTHQKGAPKLNVDVLRADSPLMVVSMPQQSQISTSSALAHISEEAEEQEENGGSVQNGGAANGAGAQQSTDEQHPKEVTSDSGVNGLPTGACLNVSEDPMGRYELGEEIFRGRFSLIRQAIDKRSESQSHCVTKVILTTGDNRNDSVHEYEMLKEIQHENVVHMLSAYVRNEYVLLFMEKLYEPLLDRFIAKDYYNENQIAKVALQLLAAMQWMHFKGVVHMNLQPDNVMFVNKRSFNIKVIDSGAAVQYLNVPENQSAARPRHPIDVDYAAPELMTAQTVTPAVDVWNFGVIVFVLMSGFHPFRNDEEDTEEEVIRQTTRERLDLDLFFNNASQESLRLITWALKKHPHRRMTVEEGLQHRWLTAAQSMVRRRENIRFSANRLRNYTVDYYTRRRANGAGMCEKDLVHAYGTPNYRPAPLPMRPTVTQNVSDMLPALNPPSREREMPQQNGTISASGNPPASRDRVPGAGLVGGGDSGVGSFGELDELLARMRPYETGAAAQYSPPPRPSTTTSALNTFSSVGTQRVSSYGGRDIDSADDPMEALLARAASARKGLSSSTVASRLHMPDMDYSGDDGDENELMMSEL